MNTHKLLLSDRIFMAFALTLTGLKLVFKGHNLNQVEEVADIAAGIAETIYDLTYPLEADYEEWGCPFLS